MSGSIFSLLPNVPGAGSHVTGRLLEDITSDFDESLAAEGDT